MIGDKFDGYEVLGRIGVGGMGEVFEAVHEETGQRAAVKFLSREMAEADPQVAKRFRREIMSCRRIEHENIVKLLGHGVHNGQLYYAMELIPGQNLKDYLETHGNLSLKRVLRMAEDVCRAFVYLHARGFVHRDIKPGNLMLSEDGSAKIVDFGLVKATYSTNITSTGIVMGTPSYMSPEMLQGRTADARSDIFQLGLVLYRALTGREAFQGETALDIAEACIMQDPPAPHQVRSGIPEAVSRVVMKCIAKSPDDRYPSATDLLEDLSRVRGGGTVAASAGAGRKGASRATLALENPMPTAPLPKAPPRSGVPRWVLVTGVLAAVLSAGLAAAYVLLSRERVLPAGVGDLAVEAGTRAARISWTSETPYVTRVVLRELPEDEPAAGSEQEADLAGRDDKESGQILSNASQGETTAHDIVLPDLEPGSRYAVQVLLSNGERSLSHEFRTQVFEVSPVDVAYADLRTAILSFDVRPPSRARLRLSDGREISSLSSTPAGSHEIRVPGLSRLRQASGQLIFEDVFGDRHETPPMNLTSPVSAVETLLQRLSDFDGEPLMRAMMEDHELSGARLDALLARAAGSRELSDHLDRSASASRFFLDSQEIRPRDKSLLYGGLSAVLLLQKALSARKSGLSGDVLECLGESFSPAGKSRIPEAPVALTQPGRDLLPPEADPHRAAIARNLNWAADRSFLWETSLDWNRSIARGEVILTLAFEGGQPFTGAVTVEINREVTLVLPEVTEEDIPGSPGHRRGVLAHTFDGRFLRDGKNTFLVALAALPRELYPRKVTLVEAAVKVER